MTPTTIEPEVTERRCGGWLAVTPTTTTTRIGAVGDTREDAIRNFREALDRHERIDTGAP